MPKHWLLTFAVVFGSVGAWAQSSDHVEVFGGYSFAAKDFSGGTLPASSLNRGWNAAVNLKANRLFGFVADIAGYYNSLNTPGSCGGTLTSCSSSAYTVMFGPQFSLPLPKFTPFAHALVGVAHANQNGTIPGQPFEGNNSVAAAFGGGVDYHLTRHWALRGEADYLLTRFTYSDNQLHFSNNNARISAGVVVRF